MYGKGILVRTRYSGVGAIGRRPRTSRRTKAGLGVAVAVAAGVLGGALVLNGNTKVSLSDHSSHEHSGFKSHFSSSWSFSTLNNQNDPTFNQLLGINNRGQIAGYFGSGAAGHPNKGYLLNLSRNGSWFANENFPHGIQTQVIGINDLGVTVGFWSDQNTASMTNDNFGFYAWGGHFHSVSFPTRNNASPPVNQLLGVNDENVAVGFYTDAKGNNHGYTYSISRHRFRSVYIWGATSVTPSGINNEGDITGFFTGSSGVTKAFLLRSNGRLTTLAFPGAAMTQGFGVNDSREVVGTYTTGTGDAAKTFGFTWSSFAGWKVVNDPLGVGATTINGVNDAGDLVGFYTDAAGNTDGFLLAAGRHSAPFAPRVAQIQIKVVTPTATPAVTVQPTVTPTSATVTVPAPTAPVSQPTHY
jgi:hypothetical protein